VAPDTSAKVRKEFKRVTLQAGYANGAAAVIFDGTVRQYGVGREGPVDTYLDIYASASDLEYNWTFMNKTLAANTTTKQTWQEIAKSMGVKLVDNGSQPLVPAILPRGRVLFGLARGCARSMARTQEASWSVNNGEIVVRRLDAYDPKEPIAINMQSGMIGMPEQTDHGILCRVLLNPRITVGQRVVLNNKDVAQRMYAQPGRYVPFNVYKGTQLFAPVGEADGTYMVFVISAHGDTRGQEWYNDLVLLEIDPSSQKVTAQ
jgi:hypothetical protein